MNTVATLFSIDARREIFCVRVCGRCLRCHGQTECDLDRVYGRANIGGQMGELFLSGNF